METVSIKASAKLMCEPLTVNRLLKAIRTDNKITSVFWPRLLKDTKTLDSDTVPTGPVNILDYVFVNKYADKKEMVRTDIYDPSIRQMELSDHEALLTTITEVNKG